jgi:peptidoglycan/LPS O-acetylase OafA/YrhL
MKHRFEVLDIFRGIFASFIFCYHLSPFANTPLINNEFFKNLDLFVDFFFVLSGFVISYRYQSIASANELKTFFKKRLLRLYPLHFILLFIFVGIELVKHYFEGHVQINQLNNLNNNWTSFFSSLFLLNSVKLPGVNDVSWNIPSWSISAETIAYIVFGGTVISINKLFLNKIKNFLYFFIIAISVISLVLITGNFKLTLTYDFGFLRGILGFFTGVICFNVFIYLKKTFQDIPSKIFSLIESLLIILMIIMICEGSILKEYGYLYEIFFFISIFIFAFEKGVISTYIKKPIILHKIGSYSYSIYMVHTLFISIFNIVFIRLLKFPPSAYSYLIILNYYIIYKVSQWSFKNIEMKFSFKATKKS